MVAAAAAADDDDDDDDDGHPPVWAYKWMLFATVVAPRKGWQSIAPSTRHE